MKHIPEVFNAILFGVLLVLPLAEARWSWPRYLKKLADGKPGARLHHFRNLLIWEWVLTLGFLANWAGSGRPWSSLLVGHTSPMQSLLFLIYALLFFLIFWRQRRRILARPAVVERLEKRLDYAEPLLPHTLGERRLFWVVSATAGICEETLYRGFLTWYIAGWTGPWAAIVLSSLIFGLGHVYLGVAQVPRTFLVGLVLALLAYFSGSLWPSIVLHAAIDWNAGELGYALLNRQRKVIDG
ncbi:MAG: CPBP family intramembrane glutamic endopeptidase [Terracidiphilus sp.]